AEDGIRDDLVTGVQTCALPIWRRNADNEYQSLVALILNTMRNSGWGPDDIALFGLARLIAYSKMSNALHYNIHLVGVGMVVDGQIGRASCRASGERAVGGGCV